MTSCLTVLDHTGDTELTWDKNNGVEIGVARDLFAKLKSKGYLAYKVSGTHREQIREFDATAEKIVMSPQLVGG